MKGRCFTVGFMFYVWIIVMVLAVIIEIATTDLTSIWFAIGAAFALILNLFIKDSLISLQVVVFAVISIVAIFVLKPIVKKKMTSNPSATNIDALIGKTVIVVQPITPNFPGAIKVEGIEWTAKSEEESFEPGDLVEIVSVSGNTFMVKNLIKKG